MIKTRLVRLLSHAGKYILYQIFWQWGALAAQIVAVFTISGFFENLYQGDITGNLVMQKGCILAAVLAGRFLCDRMAAKASYQASVDVKRVLRDKIYEKLLRIGASYHEKIGTSEVVQLSTEGVEQLETYFGKYLPQLFYSLLAPVTLFIVLSATASVRASVVLLVCVPLIPLSIVAVQKIAKRLLNKYWSIYTGLGDSFLENLQGLTTLKIYQADGKKAKIMDREAAEFRRITMKVLTMQLNSTSVMDIVAYGGAAVGMIVAANEFLRGAIDFGQAMCIVLLASEFFIPLRLLGSFFHIAMNGMAASDKIFHLLDLEEDKTGERIFDREQLKELSVEMNHVYFSYQKEREILHGVSLKIPAGSFVSLVGESGCGKSTIASLLTGKNRGYTGQITLGGVPIADLSEAELMRHVTVVRHNSYLFKGTVRENLRLARPDAAEREMEEVLEKVNLWGYLQGQEGLDTMVSENGGNLSGGQRQRLSMARALLHDSEMYIFDEATSNIDAESEEMIMEVIHELAKQKTVLLISHRLFNVVSSDCIYMLRDGAVAESGTHKELMAERGTYYKLYERQRELERFEKGRVAVG
ncbi:MAG TPA: cysteine ABC transporter ATP-binding protein [Lachnospiraceae bacterium]|nr:cysteine ABC transporter ATP-binding protein [Lachnospiraceae bacterium]